MTARRYDTNKLRYDLVADSLSNIVEVYTKGAAKYTLYQTEDGSIINGNDPTLDLQSGKYTLLSDGANNWKKGLSWSKTIAAVQRHIAEWKLGNDHDPDLGTKHLANAAWGLLALMEYEKIHPELDDRITYKIPKIGLDIDSVLNEFDTYFLEYLGLDLTPQVHWNDPRFRDPNNWEKINTPDFWENIPVKLHADLLPFEPVVYVTTRSINPEWTINWLNKHRFPQAPVYHVGKGNSKLDVLKNIELDMFVDDHYHNFVELNNNGVFTKLFNNSANMKYKVPDHMRINSLLELK